MRAIKFRVWDETRDKMHENNNISYIDFKENLVCVYDSIDYYEDTRFLFKNDSVIMQFTGLKDKNGKEIYEGDILLCCDLEINGTVFFNEGCFRVQWENCIEDLCENCDVYEVIGNIHENPELMK